VNGINVKKTVKDGLEKLETKDFDFVFIDAMGTQELLEMLVLTFPLMVSNTTITVRVQQ
jgi:hypothetical protein